MRRSSELLVLIMPWCVFRRIARQPTRPLEDFDASERRTSLWVAAVLVMSTGVILFTATLRLARGMEVGWIAPGLLIACAGGGVNCWLWRRDRELAKREPSPLSDAQWRLYRGKTLADGCVVRTLVVGALTRGRVLRRGSTQSVPVSSRCFWPPPPNGWYSDQPMAPARC